MGRRPLDNFVYREGQTRKYLRIVRDTGISASSPGNVMFMQQYLALFNCPDIRHPINVNKINTIRINKGIRMTGKAVCIEKSQISPQ